MNFHLIQTQSCLALLFICLLVISVPYGPTTVESRKMKIGDIIIIGGLGGGGGKGGKGMFGDMGHLVTLGSLMGLFGEGNLIMGRRR